MERKDDIKNMKDEKISLFVNITSVTDIKIAEAFLKDANWDENIAINNYYRDPDYYKKINNIKNPPNTYIRRNEIKPNNKKDENFLEFYINDKLLNTIYNYNSIYSYLNFIGQNLKVPEKTLKSFINTLKNNPGIIIIFNTKSFNKLKQHITEINKYQTYKEIIKRCSIFPIFSDTEFGQEIIQQLSCVSYPAYLFCKYKDSKYFYISDRMEGAFNLSFIEDAVFKIIPEKNSPSNRIRNININDKSSKVSNQNIGPQNSEKKEKEKNDIKNKVNSPLDQRKYSNNINSKNNIINNKSNKNNINNNTNVSSQNNTRNKNNIIPQDKKPDNKVINDDIFSPQNYGEFNFRDSIDMVNYFRKQDNLPIAPESKKKAPEDSSSKKSGDIIIPNPNHNQIEEFDYLNNFQKNSKKEDIPKKKDNYLADSIYGLSDGQILQKREREIRELEMQQQEKEKKEKEEKQKIKKYEDEAKIAKSLVPEEPDEKNPNACHLVFRAPDGEQNIQRRFLKSEKVQVLFYFIKSMGRKIFTEPESNDFDILCLGFPPKNLGEKKNNTLEEEGLFPNSLLQIKEK